MALGSFLEIPSEVPSGFNIRTCRWLQIASEYSSCFRLGPVVGLIIMALQLQLLVAHLIPTSPVWGIAASVVDGSIECVLFWITHGLAEDHVQVLIGAVASSQKKDGDGALWAATMNVSRDVVWPVVSADESSLVNAIAYLRPLFWEEHEVTVSTPVSSSFPVVYSIELDAWGYWDLSDTKPSDEVNSCSSCKQILPSFGTSTSRTGVNHEQWLLESSYLCCLAWRLLAGNRNYLQLRTRSAVTICRGGSPFSLWASVIKASCVIGVGAIWGKMTGGICQG